MRDFLYTWMKTKKQIHYEKAHKKTCKENCKKEKRQDQAGQQKSEERTSQKQQQVMLCCTLFEKYQAHVSPCISWYFFFLNILIIQSPK